MNGPDPWLSPRAVFGTGTSRDPPKSAFHAIESICRKHGNCDTPGMVTISSIIHLKLVTQHAPLKGNGQEKSRGLVTILRDKQDQNYVKILSPTKGTSSQLITLFKPYAKQTM